MVTLLKIGGSLITDKRQKSTPRLSVIADIARIVKNVLDVSPLPLIIGHGSGSFGHFEASAYQTHLGVHTPEQWHGFTRVSHAANQLNMFVMDALLLADVPAFRFQPSASLASLGGVVQGFHLDNVRQALAHGLVPVLHGDVSFDNQRGGTIISTESLFTYLAQNLDVTRIVLLGEVDGVLDEDMNVISHIHTGNFSKYAHLFGKSSGVDVTGGMLTKVTDMLHLAQSKVGLKVYIVNGLDSKRIASVLRGESTTGTLISADAHP